MRNVPVIIFLLIASKYWCYSQVDSLKMNDTTKNGTYIFRENLPENSDKNLEFNKEYYATRSVINKKIGNTFLGTGLSLIVGGLIIGTIIEENKKNYDGVVVAAAGLFFGSISCLISIPFFISSNHNAKLAKSLP